MTMAEAADYLRFNGDRAADKARQFLKRNGVRLFPRGHSYLVRQESIEALLTSGMGDLDREAHERISRSRVAKR